MLYILIPFVHRV